MDVPKCVTEGKEVFKVNELEQKIKESFDETTIRTTSNDILFQYKASKKEKPHFSWNRKWTLLACSFACIAVLIPFLILHFSSSNEQPFEFIHTSNELTDDTILSTLSVELLCGKSFDSKSSNRARLSSSIFVLEEENEKGEITDFETIVEQFHPVSNTVISLLDRQDGMTSYFKEVQFQYQEKAYHYAFISGDDTIYLNQNLTEFEEIEVEVLVLLNGSYYQGFLDYQMNQKKLEMELTYQKNDTLITIKKETKNDKFELSYSEKTSSSEIEYEIELEYDDGQMICEYEYEANEQELEIQIKATGNYTYFITGESIEDILLTVSDNQKIYESNGKIIKK